MKLSTLSAKQGISYTTAWRWWKAGKLPVFSEQVASGTIIVHENSHANGVAIYARVSSSDRQADLDRQIVRLTDHAMHSKLIVVDVVRFALACTGSAPLRTGHARPSRQSSLRISGR